MKKTSRREYDAPMVELIEAHVEKGFQTSLGQEGIRSSSMEGVNNSNNNYDNSLFN